MAHYWKRIFSRKTHLSTAIERAVEAQAAFETQHPVPFDLDQRTAALATRARIFYGAALPDEGEALVRAAAREWKRAVVAAEESPNA